MSSSFLIPRLSSRVLLLKFHEIEIFDPRRYNDINNGMKRNFSSVFQVLKSYIQNQIEKYMQIFEWGMENLNFVFLSFEEVENTKVRWNFCNWSPQKWNQSKILRKSPQKPFNQASLSLFSALLSIIANLKHNALALHGQWDL